MPTEFRPDIRSHKARLALDLKSAPWLRQAFTELVPSQLDAQEFWRRHLFLYHRHTAESTGTAPRHDSTGTAATGLQNSAPTPEPVSGQDAPRRAQVVPDANGSPRAAPVPALKPEPEARPEAAAAGSDAVEARVPTPEDGAAPLEPSPVPVAVEQTLFQHSECFVYRLPPRARVSGYMAQEWGLENPAASVSVRLTAVNEDCAVQLWDRDKMGNAVLFARSDLPLGAEGAAAVGAADTVEAADAAILQLLERYVEPVRDSSRYFVLLIQVRFASLRLRQKARP